MLQEDFIYKLIVKDSEFKEASQQFVAYHNVLDEAITQYDKILCFIAENDIPSGATHDAIVVYCKYIEELKKISEGLGKKFEKIVNGFLKDIELADDYLYDAIYTSNIVRDFSDEEYERLVNLLDDPWTSWTDSFGDFWWGLLDKFASILQLDFIKSWMQTCHRILLDYNNEVKQGLYLLFENVESIDKDYGETNNGCVQNGNFFTCKVDSVWYAMDSIAEMLNVMSDIIDPSQGSFTVEKINDRLGAAYKTLLDYYNEAIAVSLPGDIPNEIAISSFASQDWSYVYFDCFCKPINDYYADMGGFEAFKMVVFNMFDITDDKLVSKFYGEYDQYMVKEQMLDVLEDYIEGYTFDGSDEEDCLESCKYFLKYIKEYGDGWYDYMNSKKGKDGKKLLDGRTKEAKWMKEVLESIGGAERIISYGEKGVELLSKLLTDYERGLEVLDSFERNFQNDDTVMNAVKDVKKLYDKEFWGMAKETIETAGELGIDYALSVFKKSAKKKSASAVKKSAAGVLGTVSKIRETIDIGGELTGVGTKAKSMYKSMYYHELYMSSSEAYQNALEKVRNAEPEDENYSTLTKDLENCFDFHKKNIEKLYDSLANSTDGVKSSYYKYCSKTASGLSMYDDSKAYIMSYDEYVALSGKA